MTGLDNIIAAARGNFLLVVIGLLISIPILAGAALAMSLLERLPVLVWAGWLPSAGSRAIVATDPAVLGYLCAFGETVATMRNWAEP